MGSAVERLRKKVYGESGGIDRSPTAKQETSAVKRLQDIVYRNAPLTVKPENSYANRQKNKTGVSANVSGEAWTRATPSQTKIPTGPSLADLDRRITAKLREKELVHQQLSTYAFENSGVIDLDLSERLKRLEKQIDDYEDQREALQASVSSDALDRKVLGYMADSGYGDRYFSKENLEARSKTLSDRLNAAKLEQARMGNYDSMLDPDGLQGQRRQELDKIITAAKEEMDYIAGAYSAVRDTENREKVRTTKGGAGAYEARQSADELLKAIDTLLDAPTTGIDSQTEKQAVAAIESKTGLKASQFAGNLQQLADAARKTAAELAAKSQEEWSRLGFTDEEYQQLRRARQNTQQKEEYKAKTKKWKEFAEDHPVLASTLTVMASPMQGVDFVNQSIRYAGHSDVSDLENYIPADVYSMDFTNFNTAIRSKVSERLADRYTAEVLEQNVASFLYNTGMSAVDSMAQVATFGMASIALMGMGAASQTAQNVISQGGTNEQAFKMGLAAGAAEMLCEKFSVDGLLKLMENRTANVTIKKILSGVIAQTFTEGAEEMTTEITNLISDAVIMGDKSGWAQMVQGYRASGMSPEDAKLAALKDCLVQVGVAGAAGALSGFASAGAVSAGNRAAYAGYDTYLRQALNSNAVSAAADPQVQAAAASAESVKEENPKAKVLDAAATAYMALDMGNGTHMRLKTAEAKAAIVGRLIAGERVENGEIDQLTLKNPNMRRVFTELTGVVFPEDIGKRGELVYTLARGAHDLAVQAQQAKASEETARQAQAATASERIQQQSEAMDAETAVQAQTEETREQVETPPESQETLTQRMAAAGFQANPETQERIAQAQDELNVAVNGTVTAPSRKVGNARNSITLKNGGTLTRDQFKKVIQELYAGKNVRITDAQMNAAFNNFLTVADRGGDISGLEAMTEYLKEESNAGEQTDTTRTAGRPLRGPVRRNETENDARATGGEPQTLGGGFRSGQAEGAAAAEAERGAPGGRGENRDKGSVRAVAEIRDRERDAGRGRRDAGYVGETERTAGDDILPEIRGELHAGSEKSKVSVKEKVRRIARKRAEEFRRTNFPTERRDVGTGMENDILPEKYWPKDVRKIAAEVRAKGGEFYVTVGAVHFTHDGQEKKADGLMIPETKTVLVRADSNSRLPGQIAGHELLHFYIVLDESLRDALKDAILFDAVAGMDLLAMDTFLEDKYAKNKYYGELEDNFEFYLDEFLCDLNGDVRDRANIHDENFDHLREIVLRTVRDWDAKQNTYAADSSAQSDIWEASSSNRTRDGPKALTELPWDDSDTIQFKSWNDAYLYFENLSDTNLAFAMPPFATDVMKIGILDSHGNWTDTAGTYAKTAEGLAQFNKEIGDLLAAYSISEEELNDLFPESGYAMDDDYAEEHYEGELDVPPDPDQDRLETEWEAQSNRDGFTKMDTKAFRKWFNDDSGELTGPDGRPKVFLRGTIGMGATKARDADEAKSRGIFFTTDPRIAVSYASGVSTKTLTTIMDAVKGHQANDETQELKLKYFRGWGPAMDYITRHFQAFGNGLRLIGLDADGNQVHKISQAERFSLQANTVSQEEFENTGVFATGAWRELADYPKTPDGLERLNLELGDHIRNNSLGIRGYGKFYLSSENTLVVDAEGVSYGAISEANLPASVHSPKGTGYSHINGLADRAFKAGYDCVVVKNVYDDGGLQTQYIVKNSSQVKSVYNRGTWEGDRPDFLFLAENEEHQQKLEDFIAKLEKEYGDGSAEAMFQTFEQLDRAKQRAEERAADAEAVQQATEWAAEAAMEAAKQAEQERAEKKLQRQRDTFREKSRQKAAEARMSKAKAVKSARLAEQMNAGRQWAARLRRQEEKAVAKQESMKQAARERMDQLRADHQQELDDTKLAEQMNAGRKVAETKRKGQEALERERAKRKQDHKLASKDAKTAASVLRKYHKTDVERLDNAPVRTIREAYQAPTARDAIRAAADKLRTAHREFYKAFTNGTQAIDDFSRYQRVDANTSVLLRTAMAANSTIQTIRQDHLVGKDGSVIDERSLDDVFICWDGSGKHRKYSDDKQRILQDYMLHRHNIDRMSFREKALAAVEAYEQTYPWLTALEPREFAEMVADNNRIAQRYQELIEQFQKAKNKPIFTDAEGKPVTAEYSRSLVAQYEQEHPWVKEKAEGVYDWWDKFMQEWVVGESLSPEEYVALRETYPAYVPTYRKDKPGLGKAVSAFGGTVTAKKAVRAATGGTSAVANIEDSFIMLMEKNVAGQRTNMVLRSITDTAMLDDTGDFNGFAVFDWNEAPETMRWGLAAEGFEGALEAGTDRAAEKALSKENDGIYRVRAWVNGERVSATVDKELYEALDFAFNQKTGWFTKLGQTLTSPMKTFITGINPAFALRNAIRDNLTAQMNSISVVNSISGIKFEKYYAQAWKEMVSRSDNWQHFVALGGTYAGYYNNEGGTYIANLRRKRMQDLNPVNQVGKALGFIGEHTEQVTRFAEYLATIDRLPGGDTYGNRLVGIKNAAEVTVDFSRKGRFGKAINAWIPYWNPAVQGIDKTVRTFFDQPTVAGKAKVLSRAAMTTLPLDVLLFVVYHALDRDDEWEELSDRMKDAYYCIPLSDEHKFLKVPKSHDWGQIIGNPIMRMLQGLDGREDPFENYFETSIKPNFLWSNPLDAIILSSQYDLAKNEDFAGRAIVPSNYKDLAKGDQWNSDTSKYAKVVADLGNMLVEEDWLSPMQIDYMVSDYCGDFGTLFQRMFSIGGNEKGLSPQEQAKLAAEDLLGSWVTDSRYNNASVSDYYDMLDKVSQEIGAERVQKPDSYKGTPLYKFNAAMNATGGPSDQITDLNAQVRELPDGPEKDEIKGRIVELAREALEMYDAVMTGEITEPKMEMQYSQYGEKVKDELIALAEYSDDYAFLPSNYKPSRYTDPRNKKKEFVLDTEAQEKYQELYDAEYADVMEATMRSSAYRNADGARRAELLEAARDDVAEQVKDEFLKWLKQNRKSTPKK